jgi:hypothetical protein
MTRPQKIRYFLFAFFLYIIFRHILGPKLGLVGWMLTIGAYAFAVSIATGYLYWMLWRASRLQKEKDA